MVLMKNDSKSLKILISDILSWVGCGYCCCGVSYVKGKGVTYDQKRRKSSYTR
jgi:hypothetical protein